MPQAFCAAIALGEHREGLLTIVPHARYGAYCIAAKYPGHPVSAIE